MEPTVLTTRLSGGEARRQNGRTDQAEPVGQGEGHGRPALPLIGCGPPRGGAGPGQGDLRPGGVVCLLIHPASLEPRAALWWPGPAHNGAAAGISATWIVSQLFASLSNVRYVKIVNIITAVFLYDLFRLIHTMISG